MPRIPSRWGCLVLLGICVVGCDSKPSAPMLRDSPVYSNRQEGFRFLVPDGWAQTANAILPRGSLDGENFLVRYRMRTPEQGATLQILCINASAASDLAEHHANASFRVDRWTPTEPTADIEINGTPAQRLTYRGDMNGRPMTKEVVCFQQGERIYSFVGLFWANDDKAGQQLRRAVESTIWND